MKFVKFNAKVFENKRNGQRTVVLPKRQMQKCPDVVEVRIPAKYGKLNPGKKDQWW